MTPFQSIRIGDPNRTPNPDPYERTNEENERTERSGYLPEIPLSSVTRARTYGNLRWWPGFWKLAHACPGCRRIVVRTDDHHCPEEGR